MEETSYVDVAQVVGDAEPERSRATFTIETDGGAIENRNDSLTAVATPQPFGGRRWWLLCPHCDTRRVRLYFRYGRFACRECHHLAYRSSRTGRVLRAEHMAHKLWTRAAGLSSPDELPDGWIPKPPKKHWRTFNADFDRGQAYMNVVNEQVVRGAQHLFRSR